MNRIKEMLDGDLEMVTLALVMMKDTSYDDIEDMIIKHRAYTCSAPQVKKVIIIKNTGYFIREGVGIDIGYKIYRVDINSVFSYLIEDFKKQGLIVDLNEEKDDKDRIKQVQGHDAL